MTLLEIQTILRGDGLSELYSRTGDIPLNSVTDERVFQVLVYIHGIRTQITNSSHMELVRRTALSLIDRYEAEENT